MKTILDARVKLCLSIFKQASSILVLYYFFLKQFIMLTLENRTRSFKVYVGEAFVGTTTQWHLNMSKPT